MEEFLEWWPQGSIYRSMYIVLGEGSSQGRFGEEAEAVRDGEEVW